MIGKSYAKIAIVWLCTLSCNGAMCIICEV